MTYRHSTRATLITAATAAAVFALSACSSAGTTADFCEFADSMDTAFESLNVVPPNDVISAAENGEMDPFHEWSDETADDIAELVAMISTAKAGAPTEESAAALDLMERAITTIQEVTEYGASASSLDDFQAHRETEYAAVEAEVGAADNPDDIIESTALEHCESPQR